jgi:hypothetical protein
MPLKWLPVYPVHSTAFETGGFRRPAGTSSRLQEGEVLIMMNQTDGWMGGWAGGGMWLWTVIGVLVVILLVVLISKVSKK